MRQEFKNDMSAVQTTKDCHTTSELSRSHSDEQGRKWKQDNERSSFIEYNLYIAYNIATVVESYVVESERAFAAAASTASSTGGCCFVSENSSKKQDSWLAHKIQANRDLSSL